MEEIKIKENIYRIRKMNAIEVLALQSQINFETAEDSKRTYETILENLEVNVSGDKWLPVKEKKQNVYYPSEVENDYLTIKKLIKFMLDFVREVFQKSDV